MEISFRSKRYSDVNVNLTRQPYQIYIPAELQILS